MSEFETPHAEPMTVRSKPAVPTWRNWLTVFTGALVLYALTANRGAQWQDSGRHILRAVTGDLHGSLGLALVHPLHHWLARAVASIDLLEPCFAVTLISALAGAVAVANTFGCVLTLTTSRAAAWYAAGSLAVAHTFWQSATLAETYTLTAALLSAEIWCLATYLMTRRRSALWSAMLLNGLGIANHLLAGLTTPVLAVVMLISLRTKTLSVKNAVIGVAVWLLGSLPYTGLVLVAMLRSGNVTETLRSALFGYAFADEVLNTSISFRMLGVTGAFILLGFPSLLLPMAKFGLTSARKSVQPVMLRRALLAALLVHVLFVARYNVIDQHTFFVPAYVLIVIWGGVGLAAVLRQARTRSRTTLLAVATIALALTPVLYSFVPSVARRLGVLRSVERNKPYRDDYDYVFLPWSVSERSAETMSGKAVELAGESGLIVIEDSMAVFAVRYRALQDKRTNLRIVHGDADRQITEAARQGDSVVIVPFNRNDPRTEPPDGFDGWQRRGDLYVLPMDGADGE